MLGAVIGLLCGAACAYSLRRFCAAVCGKGEIPVLAAVLQPAVIVGGLLLTAFVDREHLLVCGIVMSASLILGVLLGIVNTRKKDPDDKNDNGASE